MEVKKNSKNINDQPSNKNENPDFPQKSTKSDTIRSKYGNSNKSIELIEKIPKKIVETKFNEVIDEVKIIDSICDYNKCKSKTNLMGQDCSLCKQRFCFKHGLPEVHGCGLAAKHDEREKFLHPKPLKTIRQEQELNDAKKRLNGKLKDMKVSRMQKNKK